MATSVKWRRHVAAWRSVKIISAKPASKHGSGGAAKYRYGERKRKMAAKSSGKISNVYRRASKAWRKRQQRAISIIMDNGGKISRHGISVSISKHRRNMAGAMKRRQRNHQRNDIENNETASVMAWLASAKQNIRKWQHGSSRNDACFASMAASAGCDM